mmetsp:Transcript_5072/g.13540  ORF Transcript_5072/g.13540 Transcript_5072/m.13540 type:complete len:290 (+) Transcript_5072:173-1042(+)
MSSTIDRRMAKTALGCIGYMISTPDEPSSKAPLLCFHASPRSFDEYVDVLPFLAANDRTVLAFDNPGYGISQNPNRSCSYDDIADAFLKIVNQEFDGAKFLVMGNLMGNFIAASLANRHADRVVGMVAANLYYFPQITPVTTAASDAPIEDSWKIEDDGSHLLAIHNTRKAWLPAELNTRIVHSELTYKLNRRVRYAKGINIEDVDKHDFVRNAQRVKCPTLCIKGEAYANFFDMIGYHGNARFEEGCKLFDDVEVAVMDGPSSTLNMINHDPETFAKICLQFFESKGI